MKLGLLTAVFIMLMPAFVYGADSYLCTPYLSTGFSYDEKSSNWDKTNFKIEEKYIIRQAEQSTPAGGQDQNWQIKLSGESSPFLTCKKQTDSSEKLLCADDLRRFYLNTENMKFIYSYMSGYWNDKLAETPFIEIGRCTPQE